MLYSKAKRRQRTGAAAETAVQYALNAAASSGRAWITKRPTPIRVQKVEGSRVVGHFEASPGVDYVGVLAGGRAVYFEVKSCKAGTFSLRSLEPQQIAELRRARALGARCALVILWSPKTALGRSALGARPSAWVVLDWADVEYWLERGRSSISGEALALHAVRAGDSFVESLFEVEL